MFAAPVHADTAFTINSFADTFPITQSRLSSLIGFCAVDYSQTASLTSANFATQITFPDGTASMAITGMKITLLRRIGGVNLQSVPIGLSRYNSETQGGKPNYYVLDSSENVVSALGADLLGTTVQNPKHFYITEYGVATAAANVHPRLLGDSCELVREISGTYVLNGIPVDFKNVITSSKVIVLQTKNSAAYVYKTPSDFDTTTGGVITLKGTGLSPATYLTDWWIEASPVFDGPSSLSTDFSVTGQTPQSEPVITYPAGVHFRILTTPSSPATP